jgi:hypothetical protein
MGDPLVGTPGAWIDVAGVLTLTGATVTDTNITVAQGLIEGLISRVHRASDVNDPDYYWLQRAVAWQAKYVSDHPELFDQLNVAGWSQDGFSITFGDGRVVQWASSAAMTNLNNIRNGANVTLRINSGFQSERWLRRTGLAWRNL